MVFEEKVGLWFYFFVSIFIVAPITVFITPTAMKMTLRPTRRMTHVLEENMYDSLVLSLISLEEINKYFL